MTNWVFRKRFSTPKSPANFNAKITREFAEKIEAQYLQPFVNQVDQDSPFVLADFRQQSAKSLKRFAKHKDQIFQIDEITDEELSALISYRDTFAITDLVLAQMEQIEPLDNTLAAFLRYEELLGDALLFFFRESLRTDDRLEKTQAALQREGLCIEVRNLHNALKQAEEKLTQAIAEKSPDLMKPASQLQNWRQTEMAWQTRHDQLIRFTQHFDTQLGEMLAWAKTVYATLEAIQDDVKETKADVKESKGLVEEILQKLTELMARQDLSPQIKARDEFTQHNSTSLKWIREAVSLFKQLPTQSPEYSRVSLMMGSAVSSTGDLAQASLIFQQALEKAKNPDDKALAYFNLFQVQLRRKAYVEALKHLQAALAINPQKYALHDTHKYPIEQLLGAGGMGCVFLCQRRLKKTQRVVVKCFWETRQASPDEIFKEPFLMADIAGDFVPEPLDYGYVDNVQQERAYFVTEYLEGAIDGERWLAQYGAMDLERGLQVGLQIAQGLQLAHEAGIYHLDLKPANILLNSASVSKRADVSVKIIDFGLSQVAQSLRQEAVVQQSRSGLSQFGQAIFGTLDYAPPEQRGYSDYGEPSAKSDIFAFGKTLYRLLTKERPIEVEPEALEHAPDWYKLLDDCTRADPAKRPESAEELVRRLREIEATRNAKHRKQVELANYRYIDNGDGTVTDNRTGLIWLKNANCFGRQKWEKAMQLAAELADGECGLTDGSKPGDWRLPTIDELKAMRDTKYRNPVLSNAVGTDKWKEGDAFSGVQSSIYWSSTPLATVTNYAWFVFFDGGYVDYYSKTNANYVWPLRGFQ
jgi:serine/threonine protein kinase